MANSVYALTGSTATAGYPSETFYDSMRHFYYRAYREDDAFYQEEYRLDDAGEKTHHLVREMEFVVESGSAAHTYLTENGGRHYELLLTWYTQEQQWDFSPGYREGNQRFDREIPDRCMACHNSYPESVPSVNGKYRSMPEGIGCERCHGPGQLHADERLVTMEAPDSIDYTIVNPAHLPMDRRLDVCQQCHLHGTVSLLREGREPFDFRPAEPLSTHIPLFSTREEETANDGGDHGETYFQLGLAHQKLGNLQKAVPALERALQVDSDIPERLNALAQAYEKGVGIRVRQDLSTAARWTFSPLPPGRICEFL